MSYSERGKGRQGGAGRDFKDMATERLIELLLKLYANIGSDTGEVFFQQETDGFEAALTDNLRTVKTWKA